MIVTYCNITPPRSAISHPLPSLSSIGSLRSAQARLALPGQAGVKIGQHNCHNIITLTVCEGLRARDLYLKARRDKYDLEVEEGRVMAQLYLADLTVAKLD